MKVTILNGSPKTGKSNSAYFASELEKMINKCDCVNIRIKKPVINQQDIQKIADCNALVICFPLYIDSIPSHLLMVLVQLEEYFKNNNVSLKVYAVINCGFYEGHQNHIAMEILENWCKRSNLVWCSGIGIGAGEMQGGMEQVPCGKGPKTTLGKIMEELATHIQDGEPGENQYCNPNFPRFGFQFMASIGWINQAKSNGVSRKTIYFDPTVKKLS